MKLAKILSIATLILSVLCLISTLYYTATAYTILASFMVLGSAVCVIWAEIETENAEENGNENRI